jgi:pseudaminic acid cytidylyltransferase
MKSIAIIPARGGSKRIPRKNSKDFLGKPIISYSILIAINSGLFDEVMVSTDDHEIAEIALRYGAKVPFIRSALNSQDHSTTIDVIFEVLDWYRNNGVNFEQATCIYPCSPFVNSTLLKESYRRLYELNADVVFPVIAYSHPIQRAFSLGVNNKISPQFDVKNTLGTQFFDKSFHDAGMFYSFGVDTLYKTKSLRTENTVAIEVSELHAQDIDNLEDWKLAEMKFKLFMDEKI